MSQEIKVPTVGESITEVTIAEWVKNDGDYVEMDEVIAELESDKATFELNAPHAGTLQTKANEGDTLEVGAIICEIDPDGKSNGKSSEPKEEQSTSASAEEPASDKSDSPSATSSSSEAKATGEVVEMKIPAVGESITEVAISEWLKKDGDYVGMDEVIAEIESDKATFELTAEAAGTLQIVAETGQTLEIGALACRIEVGEPAATEASPSTNDSASTDKPDEKSSSAAAAPSNGQSYATGHASPAAAKILAEKGIDPNDVQGSGRDGRITKEDAVEAKKASPKPADKSLSKQESSEESGTSSAPQGERQQRREKMSSLRKTISRRLVAAKNETAMLTTFNEVDMKPVMDLRKKYKEMFKEKYEVGLGFMSFFTKAACQALQEWPAVNAMLDENEIVYNDYCDVSIAVSSPKGLVVPVIRNAEQLSFDQVEKEVVRLAVKARDGKLSIDEMTGGTFTITNGGIFGSMLSTPIINQPQSAILGMHNIVQRPVAVNGEVVIRPVMYVALSYDHRIVDGRESVSFLYRIKELIEDPNRLLLGI
ncbi:2-oxoglutarate dehydrogenase complex dihydrolipoyllysine-residue succinyltransferase [Tunicatimonas pelagia]|uniref:2-oxoglutarate dehydrogenase complex dihydrolipoyllysine-residue succinyltransferase n=1 Tax=Tunicatimonas pelagia TaxID=931531 RepID=UPI002665E2E4|nr:2-oxoglutarate dehydrogenase complex dihydrolipoyllysine-residue succinyltransferase [Tunicatimonas pelagia]WKN46023.1 2-oxoglutarate dehydrogenase complex dihydrolipoyllysine-residue succinyltransferase [Tunicatimonas pelagia]